MDEDFGGGDRGIQLTGNFLPGCWWGMFHMLDYHQWRYIRRLHRGRKRQGRRRPGCCAAPKTTSFSEEHGGVGRCLEPLLAGRPSAEANNVHGNAPEGTQATSQTSLTATEISQENIDELWVLGFQAQHIGGDWNNPIILLQDEADRQASKLKDSCGRYSSRNQSDGIRTRLPAKCEEENKNTEGAKDGDLEKHQQHRKNAEDVMQIFEIKRELLTKIVQDPCVAIRKQLDDHQTLQRETKLAKSRSFPVADSSGIRYSKPSTLKHKQNEIWSFQKRSTGAQVMESTSDREKGPGRSSTSKQEAGFSFPDNSRRIGVRGWNQKILNHFKGFKRRIGRALKESRKESESSGKASAASDFSNDMIENHQGGSFRRNDNRIMVGKTRSFKRTSSLHESADKYARLFETTSVGEVKLPRSGSLKLVNDVKPTSNENPTRAFGRRLSLPENLSFLFSEVSFGTIHSSMPVTNDKTCSTNAEVDKPNEPEPVCINLDSESMEPSDVRTSTNLLETIEGGEEVSVTDDYHDICEYDENVEVNLEAGIKSSSPETDISVAGEGTNQEEQLRPVTCPDFPSIEVKSTPEEKFSLQGSNTICVDLNKPESHANQLTRTHGTLNGEHRLVMNNAAATDNLSRHIQVDKEDEAAFNYVHDLLMISGAFGHGELESWHSADRPLNPKLFRKLNASTEPISESTEESVSGSSDHHHQAQLLFDLTNESLLDIYEQSASYFPKAFSFSQRVRSVPKGQHMLEEVWTRVNRSRGLRPDLDGSLDDVMARDMGKGDGWLNCQWEGECVALELEDLIFDELLEEALVFS